MADGHVAAAWPYYDNPELEPGPKAVPYTHRGWRETGPDSRTIIELIKRFVRKCRVVHNDLCIYGPPNRLEPLRRSLRLSTTTRHAALCASSGSKTRPSRYSQRGMMMTCTLNMHTCKIGTHSTPTPPCSQSRPPSSAPMTCANVEAILRERRTNCYG